jgi:hypothetical protein
MVENGEGRRETHRPATETVALPKRSVAARSIYSLTQANREPSCLGL